MAWIESGDHRPVVSRADGRPLPVVASIDVRDLEAFRAYNDDQEPVLILTDGEVAVELTGGMPGPSPEAVAGATRLADAALGYAGDLTP
jgi:hypothetical protein